jgi:hypothetical protein
MTRKLRWGHVDPKDEGHVLVHHPEEDKFERLPLVDSHHEAEDAGYVIVDVQSGKAYRGVVLVALITACPEHGQHTQVVVKCPAPIFKAPLPVAEKSYRQFLADQHNGSLAYASLLQAVIGTEAKGVMVVETSELEVK